MNVYMAETYFTGKPCKRGHISARFVSTRNCIECNRERGRVTNLSEKNRLQKNKKAVESYWKDHEASRLRNRESGEKHYQENKAKINAESRTLYLKRKNRCPKWANLLGIKLFYSNCPEGMEVDHVIPLNGELVSGLHVLNNLQYLTVLENRRKGNWFQL